MEAYPLNWPAGWPRTKTPEYSRFEKRTIGLAVDGVLHELKLMKAKDIIISSNLRQRKDGLPHSDQAQPKDAGIAVYFKFNGNQQCIPCDRWQKVEHNLRAIELTIAALRGLDRWGAKDMVRAAFTGFKALPPASINRPWWEVLEVPENAKRETVEQAYKTLARKHHPDHGGSQDRICEINAAYQYAKTYTR